MTDDKSTNQLMRDLTSEFIEHEQLAGRLPVGMAREAHDCLLEFSAWATRLGVDPSQHSTGETRAGYRGELESKGLRGAALEEILLLVCAFQDFFLERYRERRERAPGPRDMPQADASPPPLPRDASPFDRSRFESIIGRLDELPTLPIVASRLLMAIERPTTTLADVEDILHHDQVMAAKLLNLANSAFFGVGQRVHSINHAILLMGLLSLRNVILSASVFETFTTSPAGHRFSMRTFWVHSVATAVAARSIAERLQPGGGESAFLAGLFHDIGKAVLFHKLGGEYLALVEKAHEQHRPIQDLEQEVLGVDHARVGAWQVSSWGLPELAWEPVRWHHCPQPRSGGKALLTNIVHVADCAAMRSRFGEWGDPVAPDPDPVALGELGFWGDDVDEVVAELLSNEETIVGFFGAMS
ncbi:MAG: HDOD domain-containing protein [Candidatus Schekmanbacteria bacterium]|nr:HDOD domain-containing protein [Candidatus Schekmanbacteria bacterium]